MILNFGKPKLRPPEDYQWHKHFTLLPICISGYDLSMGRCWTSVVFMGWVERKWYDSSIRSGWIYRLPGEGD